MTFSDNDGRQDRRGWRYVLRRGSFWTAVAMTLIGLVFVGMGAFVWIAKGKSDGLWPILFFGGVVGVGVWQLSELFPQRPSGKSSRRFADALAAAGQSKVYRASIGKWLLIGACTLGFAVPGIAMAQEHPVTGWLVTGFFGLCSLVAFANIILFRGVLVLSADGFEFTQFWRRSVTRWEDIYDLAVVDMQGGPFVGFERLEDQHKKISDINRALAGRSAMLPDTYGFRAEELAAIMEAYRLAALSSREN